MSQLTTAIDRAVADVKERGEHLEKADYPDFLAEVLERIEELHTAAVQTADRG